MKEFMEEFMKEDIYSEYLSQKDCASARVVAARDALHAAFDEYLDALQEWEYNCTVKFIRSRGLPEKGEQEG